ncbi:MAG: tetratricopeptide repeat protein [Salinibacter sp.]
MTPERWERVSEVLDAVYEHPPAEWAAVLDEVCEDPEVRAEAEAILEGEEEVGTFLEAGAAPHLSALVLEDEAADEAHDTIDPLEPGQRLGAYQITEKLGQGGMSVVYRAERADDQFEQTVAIKLLRGVLDPEVIQRFRAERRILAALDHPNIAQILDGGTTEEGRPYFVMEYVDGRPITEYCDGHRLSIEERLDLFRTVAETVQHAHRSLIIHRDLKPSNVLVREDGTVKLLDFGIAKVLDAGARESFTAPSTRTGRQLMTPEYAAPEQVKDAPITTATDVYALGILLYELLAGRRPYALDQRSPYDVVRMVCETDPDRPSTAVLATRNDAPDPDTIAEARDTNKSRLKRHLQGDLDTIVLKALRKDPEARYETAAALAEDIEAYHDGRPVRAHTGSWTYRLRKFVQRRRTTVASGALILLLLVGYAVTVTVQANRIRAERNEAEAVTAFLVDLFEGSNPLRPMRAPRSDSLTLRTLLHRGAERVRTGLDDQPAARARLMSVIGRVYTNTGDYSKADSLLRTALTLRRRHGDASSLDQAWTKQTLAYSHFRQGRYEKAEQLYRDVLATYRRRNLSDLSRRASVMNGLALVLDESGAPATADSIYREIIGLYRATRDSVPGTYFHNLAIALEHQNQFKAAVPMHRKALAAFQRQYGASHPTVANAIARMAFTYQRAGRFETADSLHRRALAMRRDLLPPNHPHLASSLVRFGWLLVQRGQVAEARAKAQEGLSILTSILPEDHWQIAAARSVLALCDMARGRFKAAEGPIRAQFEMSRKRFGAQDWRTRIAARALVKLYRTWGRPEQARRYARWLAKTSKGEGASQLPTPG